MAVWINRASLKTLKRNFFCQIIVLNPILPGVFEKNNFTKIRNFNQSEASKSSIDQSETGVFLCAGKIGLNREQCKQT